MDALEILVAEATTKSEVTNRFDYFIYRIVEHIYTKKPGTAYVEVNLSGGTEDIRCVFSADTQETIGNITDIAEHRRRIKYNPDFLNHYRSRTEKSLLDFGIPSSRDGEGTITIDTARLSEPDIPANKIDEWIFPGSQIIPAIDDSAPKRPNKKKYSLFDLIEEGSMRGYPVPATLERIRRLFVSVYNQKVPDAVLDYGSKN